VKNEGGVYLTDFVRGCPWKTSAVREGCPMRTFFEQGAGAFRSGRTYFLFFEIYGMAARAREGVNY